MVPVLQSTFLAGKGNAQCPKCGSKDKSPDYSKVGVIAGSACPGLRILGYMPFTGQPED